MKCDCCGEKDVIITDGRLDMCYNCVVSLRGRKKERIIERTAPDTERR